MPRDLLILKIQKIAKQKRGTSGVGHAPGHAQGQQATRHNHGSQLLCFLAFWAIQFYYILHGMESIRKLETDRRAHV